MIAKRIIAHLMILLIALPPQAVMADMLTQNTLGGAGGAVSTPADTSAATANSANAAAAASQARAAAQDMLTRNTLALDAVQAMQDAARAAASTMNNAGVNPNFPGTTLPDVPNGLGVGGLDFISASGASSPTQSLQNARTIVEIQQTQQQAMLEWNTFNVGRQTTVKFDQSAGGSNAASWIAFNRITDPSGNPSQILGRIEAQGQVYVINQNGIIFGGASEVNTGSLTASALPINQTLVTNGLLNNPSAEFLFSSPDVPVSATAYGKVGNVTVQAGAKITAPTTSANVGGRVALIGPNVTNNGTISTPDGQTILAAGMQVGYDAHSSDDPSLRGLDVYVGSVGAYGGTATNNGLISSERGSVVVTGKNVNQNGFIRSTTSAALNGRVDLLANYNAISNTLYNAAVQELGGPFLHPSGDSTGVVRTGQGSVIQILPEYSSNLKVVGTQLALDSKINMQGLAVYLGRDSVVYAPAGDVVISAGVWDLLQTAATQQDFVSASGQVYMDQNAQVNVSGSTAVAADASQYVIDVSLRAAELADTPLQRNSSLRGQTVTVDLRQSGVREDGSVWYGTPLANLTGYLGVIERNAGQLTTAGGTVNISAGDSFIMQQGAGVNVAGGYLEFAASEVNTTRLLAGDNLVDIAKADPSVIYDGIYNGSTSSTDARWGTTSATTGVFADNTRAESAYIYGAAAGSVKISAAAMALDGGFQGTAITGTQQLSNAPAPGSLSLSWESQLTTRSPLNLPFASPTPARIEFRDGGAALATPSAFGLDLSGAPLALRQERRDSAVLSPAWMTRGGFGSLSVKNVNGDIVVPAGVTLATRAGGSITLKGANVLVDGSIEAPAGKIDLTAYNLSPYTTALLVNTQGSIPAPSATRGQVRLASGSRLSTAGLIINDRSDAPAPLTTVRAVATASTIAGGTISISGFNVDLATGSLLDVSGGLVADKSIAYGNGGTLSISGGNDPALAGLLGGRLVLGSSLRGFSGAHGASLSVQAPVVQMGGSTSEARALLLQPSFFTENGFRRFTLAGVGLDGSGGSSSAFAPAVILAAGTTLAPLVKRMQADVSLTPGGGSQILLSTLLEPEGYRDPAEITLSAPIVRDLSSQLLVRGEMLLDAGSLIRTDALGKVTINTHTIDVLGSIDAPAGQIQILADKHYPVRGDALFASTTLRLGSSSRLTAQGRAVLLADRYGRRRGEVHDGGSITLQGNIIAEAGSLLDVSGTSAVLDLLPEEAGVSRSSFGTSMLSLGGQLSVARVVDSAGGSIQLIGGEFLHSAATLVGRAGGSTAAGGSFSVHSDIFVLNGAAKDDKDINLVVAQNIASLPAPALTPGQRAIGLAPGGGVTSRGWIGVSSFQPGGFDSITLQGNVEFRGPVSLSATGSLGIATSGVMASDSTVSLSAAYVALGRALIRPIRDEEMVNPLQINIPGTGTVASVFGPRFGTGSLQVSADLVETGFLSFQGIGNASILARQELRGNGFLDIAGHLSITAGQVYPTTATSFTITAYDYVESSVAKTGSVTIASSGLTPSFPLSGGGRLNVYASTITQGGVLRAPLGSIVLGWDGTGTAPRGLITQAAVPATQQITLKSGSTTSVSAIDPATGKGVDIPYGIIKDGTNWIDPTGLDITSLGAPKKQIRVSARNVTTESGSTLDIRGGGDLYGYRWIKGNGGSTDVLDTETSYAILPGYSSSFAPFAPFASSGSFASNLGGDDGYYNSTLRVGDRIRLLGSSLLAEGFYTLLPARYALLPGALLITPSSQLPAESVLKPGGAVQTSGYRFNSLNPSVSGQVYESFEIAPASVVRARSEFQDFSGNTFLPAAQQRLGVPVTRTLADGGYALLSSVQGMQLSGGLSASSISGGRGGSVDLSSPLDIVIAAPAAPAQPGKLLLDASLLSGWSAESLIIGGVRDDAGNVSVRTTNLTLDNAGSPLSGMDITLAATRSVTIAAGSALRQTGTQTSADALVVGGNGALVRVSGVAGAQTSRSGVTTSALPSLTIGANAVISGPSVTLDSTNATTLDLNALLTASSLQLSSGRISIQLASPGTLQPNAGLVLGGSLLPVLQASSALSLLSYSSIDFYGSGTFASAGALELHAGQIRGFNQAGGAVNVTASSLIMDNSALAAAPGLVSAASGTFNVNAGTIILGKNTLAIDQFSTVTLTAGQGLTVRETGALNVQGALSLVTPFLRAGSNAVQAIKAGGAFTVSKPSGALVTPASLGLGGQLSLEGASLDLNADVLLPSGVISLRAITGNLTVGGRLDAGGVARQFFDAVSYTHGGQVLLTADAGSFTLGTSGSINLAAPSGGGDGGLLSITAATGISIDGSLQGQGGTGGTHGSAVIDTGSLAAFDVLNAKLNAGTFTESRDIRVRNGDVTIASGITVNSRLFRLATDQGSIVVNGTVDASGVTGGRIDLIASGNIDVRSGALLTVRGQNFSNAGKGGLIWLESGAQRGGTVGTGRVILASGATLDLRVDSKVAGSQSVINSSAFLGQFSGRVHIRAPQNGTNSDLLADPLNATFLDPSAIEIEGYRLYGFNQAAVILRAGTTALAGESLTTTTINTNNTSFMASYSAMFTRLLGGNSAIQAVSVIQPGVEIVNRGGSIQLGTTTSGSGADLDLSTFRYGPLSAAGTLTMRASGNLEFYNTLSDGFTQATTGNIPERMWMATLSTPNANLPVNAQSWSYRLAAGSDFTAVNARETLPLASLSGGSTGSVLLGKDAGQAVPSSSGINVSPGDTALTRLAINPTNANVATAANRFQVIRTGTGDIEISAGSDVQLLNQFATIYTAGVSVPVVTTIFAANDFVRPVTTGTSLPSHNGLGSVQQLYAAQYSRAGGNVEVNAGRDVVHYTRDSGGNLIADSQRQLPNNWLLRRGYVNAAGQYGQIYVASSSSVRANDLAASTSWWIDFSNFFDGIATLGGGNAVVTAGRDVQNVSVHAPTNARAARGTPSAAGLVELGGGDVRVTAGRNVDGGIYYVERGNALITAGAQIKTNATRSPSLVNLISTNSPQILPEATWLPTTFFLGRGSIDVRSSGDALIGPVANTTLLPQGLNNKQWYKGWFSTYGQDSAVRVSSLGGNVTLRQSAVMPSVASADSILSIWLSNVLLLSSNSASSYQPWLRIIENNVAPFSTLTTLMPGKLSISAYAGDINFVGNATLSPSATGGLELLAAGAVNGLSPAGVTGSLILGKQTTAWVSSSISVSDASPSALPGVLRPIAYYATYFNPSVPVTSQVNNNQATTTTDFFLTSVDALLKDSGSTSGTYASLPVKQGLHTAGGLHAGDTTPVRVSALTGDISGLQLFSPKKASILAGRDITDVSLYIQNLSWSDVSIVSSGRDLVAYNANSARRTLASQTGNLPAFGQSPLAGDIQINGPGTLQVLAGRDVNLGTGSNNSDGTGTGITSIGNGRNPYLPFEGADIVLAAGMGGVSSGLGSSNAKFADFIYSIQYAQGVLPKILVNGEWVDQPAPKYKMDGVRYSAELAAMLQSDGLRGLPSGTLTQATKGSAPVVWDPGKLVDGVWVRSGVVNIGGEPTSDAFILPNSINLDYSALTSAQRDQIAMALYFLALRDAGRDRNNPDSPDVNTYRAGYEAIQTLLPANDLIKRDDKGSFVIDEVTKQPVIDTPGIKFIEGKAGTLVITAKVIGQISDKIIKEYLAEDLGQGRYRIYGDPDLPPDIESMVFSERPIPGYVFEGGIKTQARDVRTKSGGNISILAPGGGLELASTVLGETLAPPGIITESGGNISVFADSDVSIGIARIFTLRGGDINIWSTVGNIAAGSSSKTVQSAPPTRVLIDPQSASVATDLAGLATGGGIGVLATVAGVRPGNVDLIAPIGAVDAGDAGIRATGNLNIAAAVVLNAANISVGGTSAGAASAPSVATPSLGGLASAAAASAATSNSPAAQQASKQAQETKQESQTPSVITVEILGYGGGEGSSTEDERKRRDGAE